MKPLGDQLRANPDELLCTTTKKCLDKVQQGSYVYIQVHTFND